MAQVKTVKTEEELRALPRGMAFKCSLQRFDRRVQHAMMYHTAHRNVRLTLKDGSVIDGKLDATPSYFARDQRVWLRVPGRKTRKGVQVADIKVWMGFKAPDLFDAFTALVYTTSGGATEGQLAEARSIVADM